MVEVKGVRLKSKAPWSWAWAESLGLICDGRRRLKVSRQCGSNLHQRCTGKCFFTLASPEIKWFLNVWISGSTEFLLWRLGGMSWKYSSFSVMNFCKNVGHLLSR